MRVFKVRYKLEGGHYKCFVYRATQPNTTYAQLGMLTLGEEDFRDFQIAFSGAAWVNTDEVIPREKEQIRNLTRQVIPR